MKKGLLILTLFMTCVTVTHCAQATLKITGKIKIGGQEPFIQTVLQAEQSSDIYVLQGKLVNELNKLQGATVEVKGTVVGTEPIFKGKLFEVANYQLCYVGEGENQKVPWVGILTTNHDRLYLKTLNGKTFELAGPMFGELNNHPGAKVWVTGTIKRGWFWQKPVITPDAYAVIAENPLRT